MAKAKTGEAKTAPTSAPLIKFKVDKLTANNEEAYVQVASIESEPQLIVTNRLTGATIEVLLKDAIMINPALKPLENDINAKLSAARRKMYHPTKYMGLPLPKDYENHLSIILRSPKVSNESSQPVLVWQDGDDINKKNSGWRLSLVGFEKLGSRLPNPHFRPEDIEIEQAKLYLGFADWDDVEAIKSLVAKMQEPEDLVVAAALIDPERSDTIFALNKAATARIDTNTKISPDAIKTIVHDSPELVYAYIPHESYIKIDKIRLDDRIVALEIDPPRVPLFKGDALLRDTDSWLTKRRNRKAERQLADDELKAKRIKAREDEIDRWIKLFMETVEAKGWRRFQLHEDYSWSKSFTITTIPEDEWAEKIEPAIENYDRIRDTHNDFGF